MQPLEQTDAAGIMYVGEGLILLQLADRAKQLNRAERNEEISDHANGHGENVLLLRLEATCRQHPQRERNGEYVIEPEIQKIGRIPHIVRKARGNAEHDSRGGEHRKHQRILPCELAFGHEHEQNEHKVEITDLKHLDQKRFKAKRKGREGHVQGIAPEDAAGADERTRNEQNGLPAAGELVSEEHGQRDEHHRRHQKHQVRRVK